MRGEGSPPPRGERTCSGADGAAATADDDDDEGPPRSSTFPGPEAEVFLKNIELSGKGGVLAFAVVASP